MRRAKRKTKTATKRSKLPPVLTVKQLGRPFPEQLAEALSPFPPRNVTAEFRAEFLTLRAALETGLAVLDRMLKRMR